MSINGFNARQNQLAREIAIGRNKSRDRDSVDSSCLDAHREPTHENLSINDREKKTRQSVMETEERIWECEFRLVENENGRLQKEI
jgi:hypothetical protein